MAHAYGVSENTVKRWLIQVYHQINDAKQCQQESKNVGADVKASDREDREEDRQGHYIRFQFQFHSAVIGAGDRRDGRQAPHQ